MLRIDALAGGAGGRAGDEPLLIGLVNIVPAKAMRATERDFRALLEQEAGGREVRVKLFTLGAADGRYQNLNTLWETRLDGLIVTGTEPKALAMPDEPLWPTLSRLVDWAGRHTLSTIWSCFSAHAAVYRMDGITRRRLPEKLSGVFECGRRSEHMFTADLPDSYYVPHSRCNSLDEAELGAHGYTVLSGADATGVDAFTRQHIDSQFLFLQGHPEYIRSTLLFEYTRDIRRWIAGESQVYPKMPVNYFKPEVAAALAGLEGRATPAAFAAFDWAAVDMAAPDWARPARLLYQGWLAAIAARKSAGVTLAA